MWNSRRGRRRHWGLVGLMVKEAEGVGQGGIEFDVCWAVGGWNVYFESFLVLRPVIHNALDDEIRWK